MNRDDIMRLVVEAGAAEGEEVDEHLQPIENSTFVEFSEDQLKAFVALIEAADGRRVQIMWQRHTAGMNWMPPALLMRFGRGVNELLVRHAVCHGLRPQ